MIIDRLENGARYACLGERMARALRFLFNIVFLEVAAGLYDLDGEVMYYLVQVSAAKAVAAGKAEAHRNYIDVQYVVEGEEYIGYADLSQTRVGEYLAEKDFVQVEGEMALVRVAAGSFMVLFPNDAHMPGLTTGAAETVRKVVVKVKVG